MKGLLLPVATTNKKLLDEDKPVATKQNQDEELNVENATEGSSIKVSISQDSLLQKSPQHRDKKPSTRQASSCITESTSSLPDKRSTTSDKRSTTSDKRSTTSDKKANRRKSSQLSKRFHRWLCCYFHGVWNYKISFVSFQPCQTTAVWVPR